MTSPARYFAQVNPDGSLAALVEHSDPPRQVPDGLTPLTDAQYKLWRDNMVTRRWDASRADLVPHAAPPPPRSMPKSVLIDRLTAAGKLRAFRTALGYGKADGALSDDELAARERFDAATLVVSDDEAVRAALLRAGADPEAILRPP